MDVIENLIHAWVRHGIQQVLHNGMDRQKKQEEEEEKIINQLVSFCGLMYSYAYNTADRCLPWLIVYEMVIWIWFQLE